MSSFQNNPLAIDLSGLARVHRGQIIAIAVIGLVLGVVGLLFPGVTELTVAVLFGSFLVATGIFRILSAVIAANMTASLRWISGILGFFVVIAGIICLADPFESLIVLAFVIGFGWILDGVVDFMLGLRDAIRPRWFGFVSGIISIAAGVAMFVLPATGIRTLVLIGSVLLIVVSLTTLLTLPRQAKTAAPDPAI
ncbi:HdeD family acid-resistance protein [Amnibacterium flavum]|uniref:DUF308 domain-containing protein n=1 Tax=Amnibacterium flavum TaxID=2173173 RepID=A0A2V1HV73_9MICO|nr:DUF308 domain-containing protein [Amnibacterium flavum]PVZ94014.1 hypothetical protein DDQ50_09665 [Amnibacterium flavum]